MYIQGLEMTKDSSDASISIRLSSDLLGRTKEIATSKQVGYQSLIKQWLSDKINEYSSLGLFDLLNDYDINQKQQEYMYDDLRHLALKAMPREFYMVVGGIGCGKTVERDERIYEWLKSHKDDKEKLAVIVDKNEGRIPVFLKQHPLLKESSIHLSVDHTNKFHISDFDSAPNIFDVKIHDDVTGKAKLIADLLFNLFQLQQEPCVKNYQQRLMGFLQEVVVSCYTADTSFLLDQPYPEQSNGQRIIQLAKELDFPLNSDSIALSELYTWTLRQQPTCQHDKDKFYKFELLKQLCHYEGMPTFNTLLIALNDRITKLESYYPEYAFAIVLASHLEAFCAKLPMFTKTTDIEFYDKKVFFVNVSPFLPLQVACTFHLLTRFIAHQFIGTQGYSNALSADGTRSLVVIDEVAPFGNQGAGMMKITDNLFVSTSDIAPLAHVDLMFTTADLSLVKELCPHWLDESTEIYLMGVVAQETVDIITNWNKSSECFDESSLDFMLKTESVHMNGIGVSLLKNSDRIGFIFIRRGGYTNPEDVEGFIARIS